MRPYLFIEASLESQLTWTCIGFECQGISNFTERFQINISAFEFCKSHKIALKFVFFFNF